MTAMSMPGNHMKTYKYIDDLTAIKGIGPARQRWFREVLNVHSYHDLAMLSIEEVESRLKSDHQIVSRRDINSWIVAAKERVADNPRSHLGGETPKAEPPAKPKFPVPKAKWNSIAAFIVQLQTRKAAGERVEQRISVEYIPVAEDGTWLDDDPKIEPVEFDGERLGERLYEWMQTQVLPELRYKSQYSVPTSAISPQEAQPLKLNVTRIRLFQPPHSLVPLGIGERDRIFNGLIKGNEPFNIEVSFELSGVNVSDERIKDTDCWVRCYTSNRSTGEHINLGNTPLTPMPKNILEYTTMLSKVSLPPGFYRLQVIVELLGSLRSLGFLELPLLQVGEVSVPH